MNKRRIGLWNILLYGGILAATGYHMITRQWEMLIAAAATIALVAALELFVNGSQHVPRSIYRCTMLFVFFSMFLGKLCRFYELVPHWDKYLHLASGMLLAPVGYALYCTCGGERNKTAMALVFCLAFAMACAGGWEIYEFTVDRLLGLHAQNDSLTDTMWDIILGTAGGAISTAAVWFHLKKRRLRFMTAMEAESTKK